MSHVSWNRQLGLALTLFTMGTLTYWLEYKHKPNREAADEQAKKLFALKESPVKTISITDAGKTLTLSCSDFAPSSVSRQTTPNGKFQHPPN